MSAGVSVVATGLIVAGGHWATDKKVPIRVYVGLGGYAAGLALLSEADSGLANKFALMVLFLAAVYYLQPIVKWLGYQK
jgi:hypothetical protein